MAPLVGAAPSDQHEEGGGTSESSQAERGSGLGDQIAQTRNLEPGLTEDLAKFMADAAVKNVIENNGMKPTGDIKHTCKAATLGSECTARMQGCK